MNPKWLTLIVLVFVISEVLVSVKSQQRNLMTPQPKPAQFEWGKTIITDSFAIDPEGKTFTISNRGTPIDGIVIQVPAAATKDSFNLSVGYNTGLLRPARGKPSGIVLTLKPDKGIKLERHIKVTIHFTPDEKKIVDAYSIDPQGRLHSLDIVDVDMARGAASILTLLTSWGEPMPAMSLTWLFADVL